MNSIESISRCVGTQVARLRGWGAPLAHEAKKSGRLVVVTRVLAPYRVPLYQEIVGRGIPCGLVVAGPESAQLRVERRVDAPRGVRVRRCGATEWIRADVLRACSELDPAMLVVEHGARLDFTWSILVSRMFNGVPRVLWTHGVENRERATGATNAGSLGRWIQLQLADGILCYDSDMAMILRAKLPGKIVGVAPNVTDGEAIQAECGLDPSDTRDQARRRAGLPRELYMVTLGRLVQGKEPTRAVEVFHRVRRRFPDTGLIMVGEGPKRRAVLERIRELGYVVGADVVLTGETWDRRELAKWLHCGDVHLNTGYAGLNVVDALYAGLPTVLAPISRRGPFHSPEWKYLRDGGSGLFAVDDTAEALAERTTAYFGLDPDMRRRTEAECTRFAVTNLGIANMVDGFSAIAAAFGCSWAGLGTPGVREHEAGTGTDGSARGPSRADPRVHVRRNP